MEWGGHGEDLEAVVSISCECGSPDSRVKGYLWNNPDFGNEEVVLSPLTSKCESCGKIELVFDTDIHGYDPLIGSKSCSARKEGVHKTLTCSKCQSEVFELIAVYSYPDDLFEDPDEAWEEKEEDAFSWYNLLGKCGHCNEIVELADYECA